MSCNQIQNSDYDLFMRYHIAHEVFMSKNEDVYIVSHLSVQIYGNHPQFPHTHTHTHTHTHLFMIHVSGPESEDDTTPRCDKSEDPAPNFENVEVKSRVQKKLDKLQINYPSGMKRKQIRQCRGFPER